MNRSYLLVLAVLISAGFCATIAAADKTINLPVQIQPMDRDQGYNASVDVTKTLIGFEIHFIYCNEANRSFDNYSCMIKGLDVYSYQDLADQKGNLFELAPMNGTGYYDVYGNGWGVFPPGSGRRDMNRILLPIGAVRDKNGSISFNETLAIATLLTNITLANPQIMYVAGANVTNGYRMNNVTLIYDNGTKITHYNNPKLLLFNPTLNLTELNQTLNIVGGPYKVHWKKMEGTNIYTDPITKQKLTWKIAYLVRVFDQPIS